jgi:hypothetical protein
MLVLTMACAMHAQSWMVHAGITLGSPVPFGNIPEGATGAPAPKLTAAMAAAYPLSRSWSIVGEVRFCGYGSTFSTPLVNQPIIDKIPVRIGDGSTVIYEVETIFNGSSAGTFNSSHIQMPVLLSYGLSASWDVLVGPYVAWMMSNTTTARGVGTVGIRPEVVERDMEFGDRMALLDYGLQVGTQTALSASLVLDTRLVLGLTSVFDASYRTIQYPLQNVYAHLGLGYRL